MRTRIILAIISLSLICAVSAGAIDFFPMGVWYEGGVGEFRNNLIPEDPTKAAADYTRDFADMGAHGVNAAVVPNTQPDHFKPLLDAAQAGNVKLIIELNKVGGDLGGMVRGDIPLTDEALRNTLDTNLKPIMDHPALWGVQVLDEPPAQTFDRYAKVSAALKAFAPKLPSFTCLIGSGSIERFVKMVKPVAAAFDFYPIGPGTPLRDPRPMAAYDREANAAGLASARTKVPVWSVIQAHSWGYRHRVPSPAELRCMTYLSLANGCKGVWWFLYQTECNNQGVVEMDGLVDSSFKTTNRWEEVGRMTREISKLIPTLKRLTLTGDAPVNSSAVAHVLKDRSGRVYVFAVNTDTIVTRTVIVKLDALATKTRDPFIRQVGSGEYVGSRLVDGKIVWSQRLAPGDGALYAVD